MEIRKTTDIKNQFLKILCYGQPGSGKTTFAGSPARRFRTLVLSAESGLLSLQNLRHDDGSLVEIDYSPIRKFEDMEQAFLELKNGKHPYTAIGIDSLTEIQKVCMDHIMETQKREQMEMRDWGTLAMKIERMVRSFRDLPMHVIVTALEESETDKLTGEVRVLPALKGSVQQQLPAYFDEVFYCYAKEITHDDGKKEHKHYILTRNSGKFIGKDRSGKLPAVMVDPDFGKVYDLVFTQPKEKNDADKV